MGTSIQTGAFQAVSEIDVISTGASAQYAITTPLYGSSGSPTSGAGVATSVTQASGTYTLTLNIDEATTEYETVQVAYCTAGP